MRNYELTLVLAEGTTPAKKKSTITDIEKVISGLKGKVGKTEEWADKAKAGIFLNFVLELDPQVVKDLSDKIKVDETILKYLLVRK